MAIMKVSKQGKRIMTDLTLSIPDEIMQRAKQLAETTSQPIEVILVQHLQTLSISLPQLPVDIQTELDALQSLSNDALWTIAQEQLPDTVQSRAHDLMNRNTQGKLTTNERAELESLTERADKLMIRKAEAATILQKRGVTFTQKDFKPRNE